MGLPKLLSIEPGRRFQLAHERLSLEPKFEWREAVKKEVSLGNDGMSCILSAIDEMVDADGMDNNYESILRALRYCGPEKTGGYKADSWEGVMRERMHEFDPNLAESAELLLMAHCTVAMAQSALRQSINKSIQIRLLKEYWTNTSPIVYAAQTLPGVVASDIVSLIFGDHKIYTKLNVKSMLSYATSFGFRSADVIQNHYHALNDLLIMHANVTGKLAQLDVMWCLKNTSSEHGSHDDWASLKDVLRKFIKAYLSELYDIWGGNSPLLIAYKEVPQQFAISLLEEWKRVNWYSADVIFAHDVASPVTRYWLPTLSAAFSFAICANYIFERHDTLLDILKNLASSLSVLFHKYVLEPAFRMYEIIRYDKSTLKLMNERVLDSDVASLTRMVVDLQIDSKSGMTETDIDLLRMQVSEGDLSIVLESYERYIKHPLRSILFGDMIRNVLIQIQKSKVDLETATSALDKLMRANELNFQIIAFIPTVLAVYWLQYKMRIFLRNHKGILNKHIHSQIRRTLRDVERLLNHNFSATTLDSKEEGYLLINLVLLHRLVDELPRHADRIMFREDLLELELFNASETQQRMQTVTRMYRTYECLAHYIRF